MKRLRLAQPKARTTGRFLLPGVRIAVQLHTRSPHNSDRVSEYAKTAVPASLLRTRAGPVGAAFRTVLGLGISRYIPIYPGISRYIPVFVDDSIASQVYSTAGSFDLPARLHLEDGKDAKRFIDENSVRHRPGIRHRRREEYLHDRHVSRVSGPDVVTGPVLGVLMLDMRFPRPPGDIGNPRTFPCPVIYRTVPRTNADNIVSDRPLPADIVSRFMGEAVKLQHDGATVVTTSCGFLSPLQHRLEAALTVPVVSSALWYLPSLRRKHGMAAKVGILTFDSRMLAGRHIPDDGPFVVEGFESGGELYRVIANDELELDEKRAARDATGAARRLLERQSDTSLILLECTNLPPYADAIARDTGLPVYDIRHAIHEKLAMKNRQRQPL